MGNPALGVEVAELQHQLADVSLQLADALLPQDALSRRLNVVNSESIHLNEVTVSMCTCMCLHACMRLRARV